MTCVFPFFSQDVERLHTLLRWIDHLGGCKLHKAVLVADAGTPYQPCAMAKKLADKCFNEVHCISNPKTVKGWPAGPNSLFWAAANFCEEPWLLMETDAVPLVPGWLNAIEVEYKQAKKPWMGNKYSGLNSQNGMPMVALSGVAVYPGKVSGSMKLEDGQPWDMTNRELMLDNSHTTNLIQHFYGEHGLPPTFVERKGNDTPRNAFTLDNIHKDAVLFHRNKDGTLIELLQKKRGITIKVPKITVGYIYVSGGKDSDRLARRFIETYNSFPAGIKHSLIVICNGMMLPPEPVKSMFEKLGAEFYWRSNDGFDIGGYVSLSKAIDDDLLVCLGESVFFHRENWLKKIADSYEQYGPGMYGMFSSDFKRRHLPTMGFAISPGLLRDNREKLSDKERHDFENGENAMCIQLERQKQAVKLVTWTGAWDKPKWRALSDIMWRGDQSECLVFCKYTEMYLKANASEKAKLETMAGTK